MGVSGVNKKGCTIACYLGSSQISLTTIIIIGACNCMVCTLLVTYSTKLVLVYHTRVPT